MTDIEHNNTLEWPTLSILHCTAISSLKSVTEQLFQNISIILYIQSSEDTMDTLIQIEAILKRMFLNRKIPYLILIQNQQIGSQILNSHDNSEAFMMYTENNIKQVNNRIFQFIEQHLDSIISKKKDAIYKLEHSLDIKQSQIQLNVDYFDYLQILGQRIVTIESSKLQEHVYSKMKIHKVGYFSVLLNSVAFMSGELSKKLDNQTRNKVVECVKDYMLTLQRFYTSLLEQIEHNSSVELLSLFNSVYKVYSEILRIQSGKFISQQLRESIQQEQIKNSKLLINMQQLPPDQNVFHIFQQTFKVLCKIFRPDVGVFNYLNNELLNPPETDEKIAAITINNNNYKIFIRFHCITLITNIIYTYSAIFIPLLKILYTESDKINNSKLRDKIIEIANLQQLSQSAVKCEVGSEISQEYKQLILQYPSSFYTINLLDSLACDNDHEHWEWIPKLKGAIVSEKIDIPSDIQLHQIVRTDVVNNFEIQKAFQIAFEVLEFQNFNQLDFRSIICFLFDHISKIYSLIQDKVTKEYSIEQQQKYQNQVNDSSQELWSIKQVSLPYINIHDLRPSMLKTYTHDQLEEIHQKLNQYNDVMPYIYQCLNKLACRIINVMSIQFSNNIFDDRLKKIPQSILNKIINDNGLETTILGAMQNDHDNHIDAIQQKLHHGNGFIFLHLFKLKLESYKLIFEVVNPDLYNSSLLQVRQKMEDRIFEKLMLFLISMYGADKTYLEPVVELYITDVVDIRIEHIAQLYVLFPNNQLILNKINAYKEDLVLYNNSPSIFTVAFVNGYQINIPHTITMENLSNGKEKTDTIQEQTKINTQQQNQPPPNKYYLCYGQFKIQLPYFPIIYVYDLEMAEPFYSMINNNVIIMGPSTAKFVPCKIVKNECGQIFINKTLIYPFETFYFDLEKANTIWVENDGELHILVNTQVFQLQIKPLIQINFQEIDQNVYKLRLQKDLQRQLSIVKFNKCEMLAGRHDMIFTDSIYIQVNGSQQSIEFVLEKQDASKSDKNNDQDKCFKDIEDQNQLDKQKHFIHIKQVINEKPNVDKNEIIVYNLKLPYKNKPFISCIYPEIIQINQIFTLRIEIDQSRSGDVMKKLEYIKVENVCDDVIISALNEKKIERNIFNNTFNTQFICSKVGHYSAIDIVGVDASGVRYSLNKVVVTVI